MTFACYAPLPYEVRYKDRVYKLSPAFDNVLRMLRAVDDPALTTREKTDVMLYYLLDEKSYPVDAGLLAEVCKALFPGIDKQTDAARVFDYVQDAPLIYAGFMQAYGIDLYDELGRLHWCKFIALLQGLPADTRFSEVVQIRMRPMPAPTKYNADERAELARLKMQFALRVGEAERQEQLQAGLRRMTANLLARVKNKVVV